MNIQYAVKDDLIYVLEVNPRALSNGSVCEQATGISYARLATKSSWNDLERSRPDQGGFPSHVSVKESVFPFARFPGVDHVLSLR